MNPLGPAIAVLAASIAVGNGSSSKPHRVADDSLLIELTSTVPGREVEFRIAGLGRGAQLGAASLTRRGDTLFVTTPARLHIETDRTGGPIEIDVRPGEPWLHGQIAHEPKMDVWGAWLRIEQPNGHSVVRSPVLRMGTLVPGNSIRD